MARTEAPVIVSSHKTFQLLSHLKKRVISLMCSAILRGGRKNRESPWTIGNESRLQSLEKLFAKGGGVICHVRWQ